MTIPARVRERVVAGLKKFVPVIQQARQRDVSEADTVTIVKDILSEVMGYDKYAELTSEHSIRGTYCDLAVKVNGALQMLIEVKSAGTNLDDRHVKQAVDYAANQGCDWVILTNGTTWRLYQVLFGKPIDKRLLTEIDLTTLELRKEASIEQAWLLTKEGFLKGAHVELRDRKDATSRFTLAALMTHNEALAGAIRRELRRVVDVLIDEESILTVLRDEVIKRDCLEGPEAEAAARRVNRLEGKSLRAAKAGTESDPARSRSAAKSQAEAVPLPTRTSTPAATTPRA